MGLQGQGHSVIIKSTHWMVLSQEIFMWNIKAQAINVQKLLARLKFSKNRSNSKVKGQKNGNHGKVLSQGILCEK